MNGLDLGNRGGTVLFFVITLLLFSSIEVASKPLMGHVDPFMLTFVRFALGGLVLLAALVGTGRHKRLAGLPAKMWLAMAALGLLNGFFSMSMLQLAVYHGNASTAAALFCSNPIFVFGIATMLGLQRFSWIRLAGVLFGVGGVLVIFQDSVLKVTVGGVHALLAAVGFATYTVFNKRLVARVGALALNAVSFAAGITGLGFYVLLSGRTLMLPNSNIDPWQLVVTVAYLGIMVTGLGYVTFMRTVHRFTPTAASVIFLLKPAVASLYAWWFLDEVLNFWFLVGTALIMLGSLGAVVGGMWADRRP
jgi:drug/metabolite transporter (DMT)-like permease